MPGNDPNESGVESIGTCLLPPSRGHVSVGQAPRLINVNDSNASRPSVA